MLPSPNTERKVSESAISDESYHIFINNVDSFNGKYILSSLHKQGFEEVSEIDKEELKVKGKDLTENSDAAADYTFLDMNGAEELNDEQSLTFDQIINAKGPRIHSKYRIYGSLTSSLKEKPEGLYEITAENNEQFRNIITNCDCVIYDISLDQCQIAKALTALSMIEQEIERHKGSSTKHSFTPILFILISTCMTWALTPRMNPSDPDPIPFVESDYRRRKPHPNYNEHYDCEREVIQKGRKFKTKLRTMVVCSGVTYGFEENILAFLFEKAWRNDHYLPIFGDGSNFIPLIHVGDLGQVIGKLVDMPLVKNQYILAVEQTPTCLKYIIKYISRALGQGGIEYVATEEAYLYSEMDHYVFDFLTTNIIMVPEFLITPLGIRWRSVMNIVENIDEIVQEFKTQRNLEPLKIFINGPPCAGKTKLAKLLCEHYNLHYIEMKSILNSSESKMVNFSVHPVHSICKNRSKTTMKEGDKLPIDKTDFEDFIDSEDIDDFFSTDIQDSEEENYQKSIADDHKKYTPIELMENSRLSEEQIAGLLRKEMFRNHSQNLGFVLDGYPNSSRQAAWIFRNENYRYSVDSDETSGFSTKYDKRLMPNFIIDLNASYNFLLERISSKPEELIQNTHYNERDMIRRLMTYRDNNKNVLDLLSFFHDYETEIIEINVSEFPSEDFNCIFHICVKVIGVPRGFGLTKKEVDQLKMIGDFQKELQERKKELQTQLQIKTDREESNEEVIELLEKYHQANVRMQRVFGPRMEKYRVFMTKKVSAVLSRTLMTVGEKKPKNFMDFTAGYLFKNNKNGRMYKRKYSRNGEELRENNIQSIINSLL